MKLIHLSTHFIIIIPFLYTPSFQIIKFWINAMSLIAAISFYLFFFTLFVHFTYIWISLIWMHINRIYSILYLFLVCIICICLNASYFLIKSMFSFMHFILIGLSQSSHITWYYDFGFFVSYQMHFTSWILLVFHFSYFICFSFNVFH